MRFERFLEFPLVRIALGLLLTIVLILPAQVLASGASAVSVRGALAELYTAVAAGIALWAVGRFVEKRHLGDVGLPMDARATMVAAGLVLGVAISAAAIGLRATSTSRSRCSSRC